MGAYKLDVGLDKFGPEKQVSKESVGNVYYYGLADEKPVEYYKRVKQGDGFEEVVIVAKGYKTRWTKNGGQRFVKGQQVIDRYREYRNKHGELVRDEMNSWIRPKRVVRRRVWTKGKAVKHYHYDSTGDIKDFCVDLSYEKNSSGWGGSRSIRFKDGHVEHICTKKMQGWYMYIGNGRWGLTHGDELLSEGSLPELQGQARNGGINDWELRNNGVPEEEIERRILEAQQAMPKYKVRIIQRGDIHGEGHMQGEWKVGEWFEKPPRCRKRRPTFYVRGVMVPEKVYKNPQELTPDEILNENNAEVRRIMLEELGYDVFLNRCGDKLKVINQDKDPHVGTLYHIRDPRVPEIQTNWRGELMKDDNGDPIRNDDAYIALLKVKDGTLPKHYVLRVPPDLKTARAANAWTWGLDPKAYAPAIER